MKKIIVFLIALGFVVSTDCIAQTRQLKDLSETTSWTMDDIMMIEDDPASSALDYKVTMANLFNMAVDSSNGTYYGLTFKATVKSSNDYEAFGQCMKINASGQLENTDASAEANMPCNCLLIDNSEGANKRCMFTGTLTNTSFSGFTAGDLIYASEDPSTNSGLTKTAPTTANAVIQILGRMITSTTILFQPSLSTAVHQ